MRKKKNLSCLAAELKASIMSPGFAAGVLLLSAVFLLTGREYREYLAGAGGSPEGAAWLAVFTYSISAEQALLFLPLFVPLGASGNVQEELKSRYSVFLAGRTGKRGYLAGKTAGAALSGGLMAVSAFALTLLVFVIWCADIPDVSGGTAALSVWGLIPDFICGFLNGALWSLVGSVAAVVTRNRYLAYAVPFILYYVLTVFQERYYADLYFLSPKQWAFPSYYGSGFCIVILLLLGAAVSVLLVKTVERRLMR